MSPQQESELGAQAYQQTVAKMKLSSDAAASEMVTRVGSRIAAVTGHPEYTWEYRLIQDDKQVNAFALLSTHPSEPARIQQIKVWMPEAIQYYRPR